MGLLNNKEIGKRLQKKRLELKYASVRKFALEANIDQSQYTKIEKGELPITENIMGKLAKKYKIDKNYILFGTNVPREGSSSMEEPMADYKVKGTDSNYIKLLEDNDRFFKDLVKTNLSKADFVQHSILAYLKAMVKKDAEQESVGNNDLEKKLLMQMGKRIASYMELPVETDIVPGN